MCRASRCFILCSKRHNARTQLQFYSRTAKRLTFLQKLCNCVHTVWCSHCGSVFYGLSRSRGVKHEARLSTAVSSSPNPPFFKSSEPQTKAPFRAATEITWPFTTAKRHLISTRNGGLQSENDFSYSAWWSFNSLARNKSGYFKQCGVIYNWETSGKFTTNQSRKSVHGCTEFACPSILDFPLPTCSEHLLNSWQCNMPHTCNVFMRF